MAAASTNYGTAGDSNLESSSDGQSRSHGTGRGHTICGRIGQEEQEGGGGDDSGNRSGGKEGSRKEVPVLDGSVVSGVANEGGIMRWLSKVGKSASVEGIEMDQGEQQGEGKMVIRKDVQYSVEFKKNSRLEDGAPNEMEYWDRYLDPRP